MDSSLYSPGFHLMMEPKTLNQEKKDKLLSEAERVAENLKEMTPQDRLKTVIRTVDAYTAAQTKGVKISCGAGCAHCCYTPVMVTETEAEVLAKEVRNGLEIDHVLLKKQAYKAGDMDGFWSKAEFTKCVFLGIDNRCRVYEKRPISCRLHFVTSHPDNCKLDNVTTDAEIKKFVTTNAEVVATAYYSTSRIGYLPEVLFHKLNPGEDIFVSTSVWNKLVNGENVVEDNISYEAAKVTVEADTILMVTTGVLGHYEGRKIKLRVTKTSKGRRHQNGFEQTSTKNIRKRKGQGKS